MNIILCDRYCATVLIVPVVPSDTLIVANGSNETMNSLDGRFRLIDNKDLRTLQWSSIFPVDKKYKFIKSGSQADGHIYVTFLELMKKYKFPIRVVMTTRAKVPYFEQLMSIDEFSWRFDKVGDIAYSIKLTEIPESFLNFVDSEVLGIKNIGTAVGKVKNIDFKKLDLKNKTKTKLQNLGLLKK